MDINSGKYKQEVSIKDVVVLAARILLESGTEGTHVEDTMTRITKRLGYGESSNFITNAVIQFMLHSESFPRIPRITSRDINLIKVSQANKILHQIANNETSLAEVKTQLEKVCIARHDGSLPLKGFTAAMIVMGFLYSQGSRLINILTAILADNPGYLVTEILDRKLHAQFIPELIGSLAIGVVAVIGHILTLTGDLATIIIAAVMSIVPDVLITNTIQDLFGGHMLMLTTKPSKALITAFGIGVGVGSVLVLV